ncbi:hypothetical protein MTO96_042940 [Rhipicephalus appendiculatus]
MHRLKGSSVKRLRTVPTRSCYVAEDGRSVLELRSTWALESQFVRWHIIQCLRNIAQCRRHMEFGYLLELHVGFLRLQEMLRDARNCQEPTTLPISRGSGRLPLEVSASPNSRKTHARHWQT